MPQVIRKKYAVNAQITPQGNLVDDGEIQSFRNSLKSNSCSGEGWIIADMSKVSSMSSHALEMLLDCHDEMVGTGGKLKFTGVTPLSMDIFRITGLLNHLLVDNYESSYLPESRGTGPRRLLGEMLIEAGLTSEENINKALKLQEDTGRRMGQIMISKGWVKETDMLEVLSHQLNVPFVKLRPGLFDPTLVNLLTRNTAKRLRVLPLFKIRDTITLATNDPQAMPSFDEVESRTQCKVRPVLVQSEEISQFTNEVYEGNTQLSDFADYSEEDFELLEQQTQQDLETIDELAAGSPVINLVNAIVQRAIRDGGSDIHIEPSRTKSRVRLRIDGVLYEIMNPSIEMHPAVVSRLKIMANLDIAERRLPQDGRIQVSTSGRIVDLRFSSLPGIFGEKVVLRVLDKNQSILDIDKIGMADAIKLQFQSLLKSSHGLILVTGPTGSGKTTSLYAAINYLNSAEKSIVTIEDPVEYQIDIVNQNQVKESTGLSFAKLLKHVLRQDPDTIMVGEIRDKETAETAIQAALTGHLVLSTLHTNDAVGAISRLLDMGIRPYLLSSALIGVVAQRLVRTICKECRTSFIPPRELVLELGWQDIKGLRLAKGRGCPVCYDSGFKGRMGIHEIIRPDAKLQKLMITNPSRDQLTEYINQSATATLIDDGMERVKQGLTSIEEIERIVKAS